jgi:hypothetical protein
MAIRNTHFMTIGFIFWYVIWYVYCFSHLVYFLVIWYIFPRFWYREKSGNPRNGGDNTRPHLGHLLSLNMHTLVDLYMSRHM